jgi:hypothetical protein
VLLGGVVLLQALDVDPAPVLAAGIAVLVLVGLARGTLRRPGLWRLQAPAAVLFGAAALLALAVGGEVGAVVVAAGLLAHAGWDLVHWRADAIIARSLAEWCAVFDAIVAVSILVVVV